MDAILVSLKYWFLVLIKYSGFLYELISGINVFISLIMVIDFVLWLLYGGKILLIFKTPMNSESSYLSDYVKIIQQIRAFLVVRTVSVRYFVSVAHQ